MKKKTWAYVGMSAFWVSWPLLFWYLRGSKRARVLIECNGKVLVVRNWLGAGKWTLPGGGTHAGEESAASAVREVLEETAIVLDPTALKMLGTFRQTEHGFRFTYDVFVTQLAKLPSVIVQTKEIADYAWVHPRDLQAKNSSLEVLTALEAWV